jgi:hypothetical protein
MGVRDSHSKQRLFPFTIIKRLPLVTEALLRDRKCVFDQFKIVFRRVNWKYKFVYLLPPVLNIFAHVRIPFCMLPLRFSSLVSCIRYLEGFLWLVPLRSMQKWNLIPRHANGAFINKSIDKHAPCRVTKLWVARTVIIFFFNQLKIEHINSLLRVL